MQPALDTSTLPKATYTPASPDELAPFTEFFSQLSAGMETKRITILLGKESAHLQATLKSLMTVLRHMRQNDQDIERLTDLLASSLTPAMLDTLKSSPDDLRKALRLWVADTLKGSM